MSDVALIDKLEKQRKLSKKGLGSQYDNTTKCREFYNGDTMSYEDRIQFSDEEGSKKRALVQFNKVQSNVDAVVGFMAQNRRQAKYMARLGANEGQELYSKNMNAFYSYHRDNTNADQIETDQDADMMISGYGAIETDLSYIIGNSTTNPNGEIIKLKLDPMNVGWDTSCKDKNLLGARWVYYYQEYDLKDVLELFQGSKPEDFSSEAQEKEGGYTYNPYGGLYDKIKAEDSVEWSSKREEKVRVYNHQWFEYETFYRVENPIYTAQTPEDALFIQARLGIIQSQVKQEYVIDGIQTRDMFDFDPTKEILTLSEPLKKAFVKEFGAIKLVPFKRKCFYTAVCSGRHIFKKFKSISQQGFSVKFKTGIYNDAEGYWTGMVNAMMQPQEYYNKALTELMFTIAANSKGGVMIEEDAVEDVADFESKWAQTDAVITMRSGSLAAGKVQQKTQGAVPTGLENIIQLSEMSISAAGVDPAFLGNISEQQDSGILFKRRIRQIISKMARYMDSITLYQKEDARLCADLIRVWVENNAGEWMRITGEDNKDAFIQVSEDMLTAEYDISIQEASQTNEDRQETSSMLGLYGDKLAATGNMAAAAAFYAESIQNTNLDSDAKNRLIKVLQPQDKQQIDPAYVRQLEQQLQVLQNAQTQAQVKLIEAETELAKARAVTEQSNASQKHASMIKTMEEASKIGAENDIIQSGNFQQPNITL